jgi:hypothetical protein
VCLGTGRAARVAPPLLILLSSEQEAAARAGARGAWGSEAVAVAAAAMPPRPEPAPHRAPLANQPSITTTTKQRAEFLRQCEALIAAGRVEELVDRLTAKLPAVYARAPAAGDKGACGKAWCLGSGAAPLLTPPATRAPPPPHPPPSPST